MSRLSRFLSQMALAFALFGLVGTTAIIFAAVVARYVVGNPLSWAEQAALLLMLWTVLLGSAAGVREGFHIRMTALSDAVRPSIRHRLLLLSEFCVWLFGLSLVVEGTRLTLMTASHDIPALGLSRAFSYLPLVIAGLLILLFAAERLVAIVKKREVEPSWPS